nr:hypothetical protein [Phytohabitans houttuyneae]
MAVRYSSVIRPRSRNGAPTAANSGSDQPTPVPRMNRPPVNWSMLLAMRATSSGWRYGTIVTVVPSSSRSVSPPSHASVVNGS